MNSLNDFIQSIEVVDRQAFKNLSLCFVRGREMQGLRMRNYDEAIEEKTLVIKRYSDVDMLRVRIQD